MSVESITPEKYRFSIGWFLVIIIAALGAHFVANYGRYSPYNWREYTSPDGSFSVELPGKPITRPINVPTDSRGTEIVTMVSLSPTRNTTYAITCVERSKVVQNSADEILDASRDGALRKIQGTPLGQNKINVQGFPALDVQARARGSSFVDMRLVLASRAVLRFYFTSKFFGSTAMLCRILISLTSYWSTLPTSAAP